MQIRRVGIAQTALRVIVAAMVVALHFTPPAVTQVKATSYPACTIQGTVAAETLTGTSGNDVICTGGGNDIVNAGAGNDIVLAKGGNVTVDLGPGSDTFDGSEAIDATVNGDDGNDTIIGTPGEDELDGGAGNDTIIGGEGNDILNGGDGADTLSGSAGNDTISGEAGSDTINGEAGDDTIIGGEADDTLNGGSGVDHLAGDNGNDTLRGGDGIDDLNGGEGQNLCDFTSGETLTRTCTYDTKCSTSSGDNNSSAGPAAMSRDGQHIAITCGSLVFVSHDFGTSWNSSPWTTDNNAFVTEMTISDDGQRMNLAQPTTNSQWGGPIYTSTNGGASWIRNVAAGTRTWWGIVASGDGRVIVATHISNNPSWMTPDGFIYVSRDYGVTWVQASIGNSQFWGSRISADGMTIVVASWSAGLWKSVDAGLTWSKLAWSGYISGLAMDDSGRKIAVTNANGCILNISVDGGMSFQVPNGNLGGDGPGSLGAVTSVSFTGDGSAMLANVPDVTPGQSAGIYYSRDLGATWVKFYQFHQSFGAYSVTADGSRSVVVDGTPPTALVTVFVGIPNSALPGRPTNLKVTNLAARSLTLSWDLPNGNGGSPITDYKIEVSSNGGSTWSTIPHSASNNLAFNVTGLAKGTSYRFRVSTVNAVGTSAATAPLSVTTLTTIPAAPTSFAANSITTSTAALRWVAPTDNGGSAITDYVIETSRDGSTWRTVPHTASTATSMNLSGLAPGTTYQVRIATKTAVGTSETLSGSFTTTAGAPLAPQNLAATSIAATTLTLTWELPTSNGGSPITDYKIEVSSNGGSTWSAISHTASNSRVFNVTGLAKGTSYRFRVSTITAVGTSAATAALAVTTLGNAPASPTALKVTATTTTTVTLSWSQAAVVDGSAVRNYIVEYSTNSGSTWTVATKAVSTSKSVTLSGFRTKSTYRFRVKAVNDVGASGYSNAVTVTTR